MWTRTAGPVKACLASLTFWTAGPSATFLFSLGPDHTGRAIRRNGRRAVHSPFHLKLYRFNCNFMASDAAE